MRCYCSSPDVCTCDGVVGTMTEQEARLAILREHQRVRGTDSATDALIEKLTRPRGRDLYLRRIEHLMDGSPQMDPPGSPMGTPRLPEDLEDEEGKKDGKRAMMRSAAQNGCPKNFCIIPPK